MPDPGIELLRTQLRDRGYLSHGIERWFALDPWSSRAFWVELAIVALKAATLIAAFAALPHTAVLLIRDSPLSAWETLLLFLLYGAAWLAVTFGIVVLVALLLKIRPQLAIDTPRALLGISIAAAALLVAAFAVWWYRFETSATGVELIAGGALAGLLFVVATIVVSAALLSFSIYELRRIPAIHQKPRAVPLAVAAAFLIAGLFVPAWARVERETAEPVQIVIRPTTRRVALVGVDGLTWDIARSRPDLLRGFRIAEPVPPLPGASAAERWASIGTGVPASLHRVRAVAGVRLAGGDHVLQSVSRTDVVLALAAPAVGLSRIQPLPPTVRRRDFVWELFAKRGVPSRSVNWWTSPTLRDGTLTSIGQEEIFSASKGDPIRLDAFAVEQMLAAAPHERFATVYLPALDVILNRTSVDPSARLARSIRALDGIVAAVGKLRERGFDVILAGAPGEGQQGRGIIAATVDLQRPASGWDVAPTLCAIFGFPASAEMPGRALSGGEERIASYGPREEKEHSTRLNQEYYESLKSLGYIR